jgi:hypothetical protein
MTLIQGHARAIAPPVAGPQEEHMQSNRELASKYQSAEDYEEDFM